MKDLMVDIETMGTGSTSAIIQLGACYFNRKTGKVGKTFLENVSLDSSMFYGCTVNASTIEWWMKQENKSWLEEPKVQSIADTLCKFSDFLSWNGKNNILNKVYVWSHSTFDIPILMNAYKAIQYSAPFHYRMTRDLRTLTHLAGNKLNEDIKEKHYKEDVHNALADCKYRVKYCVECLNSLSSLKGV